MSNDHFHEGELRLQNTTGMRERIDKLSKVMMRDHLIDQHREFFEGLEYIFLGVVGKDGRPYASLITGAPNFVSTPDPQTLLIKTDGATNEAVSQVSTGDYVGVLGLDLSNRRRNRMHGRVSAVSDDSLSIRVIQSYGNCPKYIGLREISHRNLETLAVDTQDFQALQEEDVQLLSNADTFFIASYVSDNSGAPYEGADISHRGGQPGFVSVDSSSTITVPDYYGNNLFNTLGNLLVNPAAALLFIDFTTGDQLHLHGQAEIIVDEDAMSDYAGAERLLRINIERVVRQPGSVDMRWRLLEQSPFNP